MASVSYKIKLKASVNGVEKSPSKIAWVQGNDSCLLTPCYKENDYLVIELIPDCVGNSCIEGWALFEDSCANCEPIYFKKCFCSTTSECEDCEECSADGVCVPKCKPGEYCYEDSCVECDPNKSCPNGKVCVDGHCVCPQGTFDDNGRCVQCNSSTSLSKCEKCVDGTIVYTTCDGKCDPSTGECVDCLNSGDCANREDGKGCCDANKNCVCCSGTVWDPKLGKCVAQPCREDSECGDPCMICTPEGCKPIQCPDGYKCVGGECIYWPCLSTSCENGADCGPECGCVEFEGVRQCVPCAYLQCSGLCEQALGCKCSENNTCVSSDNCSHVYCDSENPCQQPGCTCYNYTCVDCSNFPCTTAEGGCTSYMNCGCDDSNNCVGNPCPNGGITIEKLEECGTKEGCKLKVKVPKTSCKCEPIIFRTENTTNPKCDINVASVLDQPVILTPQDDTPPPTIASSILSLKTGMFKKVSNIEHAYADYKTNYNFADNELVTGTIEVIVKHQKYIDGILKPALISVGTSTISKAIIENRIGIFHLNENHIKKVLDGKPTFVTVEVWAKSISIVEANCIKYETPVLIAKYELDYKNVEATEKTCQAIKKYHEQQIKIVNDHLSVKYPRLTWYRTSTSDYLGEYKYTGTYLEKGWFRKLFMKVSEGNSWVDYINKPVNDPNTNNNGELLNNYNYIVKTDCSCGNTIGTHQNTHFCCPDALTGKVKVSECNKKLDLESFDTCLPNGVLPSASGYNLASEVNTKFYLKITLNTGDTSKIELSKEGVSVLGTNYTAPTGKFIDKAEVYQQYVGGILNEQELCIIDLGITKPQLPELPTLIDGCDGTLSTITFKVQKPTVQGFTINSVKLLVNGQQTAMFTAVDGYYQTTIPSISYKKSNTYKALVMFNNNCEKEVSFNPCSIGFNASSFN